VCALVLSVILYFVLFVVSSSIVWFFFFFYFFFCEFGSLLAKEILHFTELQVSFFLSVRPTCKFLSFSFDFLLLSVYRFLLLSFLLLFSFIHFTIFSLWTRQSFRILSLSRYEMNTKAIENDRDSSDNISHFLFIDLFILKNNNSE
jgi:hypothetical protein